MQYNLIELVGMITRAIGDIEVEFISSLGEAGLTARQLDYLESIGRLGHPTLGELARDLGLSKPSVTAIVDRFSSLGYAERVRSDDDRRSAHIHLTRKGTGIIRMHERAHENIAGIFSRNLGKKDLDQLVLLLNKVVVNHAMSTAGKKPDALRRKQGD